ncbi:universal stress protein [Rarobacter incanus]|uniref:universal stress protein n=1 Tax=Rarobacter incanus TaxID=153494 RepID=UPI001150B310|nr:universal stress protein [Rarobacter incanus]
MKTVAFVAPGTWQAVIDEVRVLPESASVTLIAAADEESVGPLGGSLFGRGGRRRGVEREAALSLAQDLVDEARDACPRDAAALVVTGAVGHAVVRELGDADLLILARDGDLSNLGPRSLGRHTRFIVDHAPCRVLLVWPVLAPDTDTLPPPPPAPPTHP